MQTLKIGCKGDDVKKLQNALGLDSDGIFGKDTEKAVKEFQKSKGLIPDGIVGPKTIELLFTNNICNNDLNIVKLPINIHISKKSNRTIKYLVIHYTGGASSKCGAARNNRNVFLNREASADFIVDDEEIIQVNPDINNYYCWAVGDGKGKYGITNSNTISIEICSCLRPGTSPSKPNHDGWYFTDKALNNAVKIAKYLIQKYNIKNENIVRHYDASKKCCPGLVGWNNENLIDCKTGKIIGKNNSDEWIKFKEKI